LRRKLFGKRPFDKEEPVKEEVVEKVEDENHNNTTPPPAGPTPIV